MDREKSSCKDVVAVAGHESPGCVRPSRLLRTVMYKTKPASNSIEMLQPEGNSQQSGRPSIGVKTVGHPYPTLLYKLLTQSSEG